MGDPHPGRLPRHCVGDSLGQIRKIRVCLVERWGVPVIKELNGVNMYLVNKAGTLLVGPLISLILRSNCITFDIVFLDSFVLTDYPTPG